MKHFYFQIAAAALFLLINAAFYVFIADSIFSYLTRNEIYRLGSFVDLLWLAGYLLIAMGASYQRIVNQAGY